MGVLYEDDRLAVEVVKAIHTGDVEQLKRLLAEHPDLVKTRIVGRDDEDTRERPRMSRTLLHIVTDWPGHFPNGAKTVKLLVDAEADVNARFTGPHTETPLHWAASSGDVEVLDALLDAGADVEADGAVIGGGTPLDDAVAFAQWKAAHRLVERGAKTKLWNESALGLMELVKERYQGSQAPSHKQTTEAFWLACHGGQKTAAQYLLDKGADLNWIGYDECTPLDAAHRHHDEEFIQWLAGQGAKRAEEVK